MVTPAFTRRWSGVALLVFLCCCWVTSTGALTPPDPQAEVNAYTPATDRTKELVQVFICADSGEYSGVHELGILQNSMEEVEVLKLPHCQSAQLGYIRHADGHAVRSLTITTGIGYISATLCTKSVLGFRHQRGMDYKSIVYIGTSGFSPMVGGWDPTNTTAYASFAERERNAMLKGEAEEDAAVPALFKTLAKVREEQAEEKRRRQSAVEAEAPFHLPFPSQLNFEYASTGAQLEYDGCAPRAANAANTSTKLLALGSVCVTSSAFFMESGSCTERTRHTQCSRPHCSGFQNSMSSEAKIYFTKDNFAKEIEAASQGRDWPEVPPLVRDGLQRFWAANEAVEPAGRVAPASPSFVTCAESTVNAINTGAERDYLCREYTAYTLNTIRRQTAEPRRDADPPLAPLTVNDVVCVQAMEGVGFLRSVSVDASAASIPVAVLRTASNYDMYPLKKHYVKPAVWRAALASKAIAVSPEVAKAIEEEDAATAVAADEYKQSDIVAYTWEQNFEFMSPEEYERFVVASFHYSVKTVTFVVSNYFFGGRVFE